MGERTLRRLLIVKSFFVAAIRSANRIDVKDDGDGMSIDTLTDVYLTIGCRHRAIERAAALLHGGFERRDGAVVKSFTQRIRNWLARVCAFG